LSLKKVPKILKGGKCEKQNIAIVFGADVGNGLGGYGLPGTDTTTTDTTTTATTGTTATATTRGN